MAKFHLLSWSVHQPRSMRQLFRGQARRNPVAQVGPPIPGGFFPPPEPRTRDGHISRLRGLAMLLIVLPSGIHNITAAMHRRRPQRVNQSHRTSGPARQNLLRLRTWVRRRGNRRSAASPRRQVVPATAGGRHLSNGPCVDGIAYCLGHGPPQARKWRRGWAWDCDWDRELVFPVTKPAARRVRPLPQR
jgi:hypothetical protein